MNQLGGYNSNNNVVRGLKTAAFSVYGIQPELAQIQQFNLTQGRFINKLDIKDRLTNFLHSVENKTSGGRAKKDNAMMDEGFDFIKSENNGVITSEDVAMLNDIIIGIIGNPTPSSLGALLNQNGDDK